MTNRQPTPLAAPPVVDERNGQNRLSHAPRFMRGKVASPASDVTLTPQGARVLMRIMIKHKARLDADAAARS